MRELLSRRIVPSTRGRLLDVAGEDVLVATAVAAQDPGCSVLVTCGDLRSYRAVTEEAGKVGGRVDVLLAAGPEDVEESGWDDVALTVSPHLPPIVADRSILQAAVLVAEGGVLWLATSNKAAKRARETATEAFGPGQKVGSSGGQRVDRHVMSDKAARLASTRQQADHLAREERTEVWLALPGTRLRFETRVGLFACRAVDPGTRLLLEWALKQPASKRILDVGCGYGVIGLAAAAKWGDSHVHLVDVDLRSVRLAEANVALNGLANCTVSLADAAADLRSVRLAEANAALNGLANCTVSLADAAADLPAGGYDLALANLPAHEGREPTLSLLKGVKRALRPSGRLAAVVPLYSGLRQFAEQVFEQVQVVTGAESHEVVVTAGNR